jgi:signal peptidase I
MEPLIQTGERLLVEPLGDVSTLKRFDVVVFWDGEKFVCHYFLAHSKFQQNKTPMILTKGLRGSDLDTPVECAHILGRVAKSLTPWMRLTQTLQIWRSKD